MSEHTLRRLGWWTFAICAAAFAARLVGALVSGADPGVDDRPLSDLAFDVLVFAFPCAGLLVVRRQPRNLIGWLMLAEGLLAFPATAYIDYGLRVRPGSLPGAQVVAALNAVVWAPVIGLVGTYLILLFPNGHLPSPRWRPVGWFSGLAIAYVYVLLTLYPGQVEVPGVPPFSNPVGIAGLDDLRRALLPTIIVLPISIVLCATGLILRLRRSTGIERLQLKWLASAGAVVGLVYLTAMVISLGHEVGPEGDGPDPAWLAAVQQIAVLFFVLIPLAIGIAIVKHRLYEIDLVINKAVVFGTLAVFISAVYVAVVVGLGSLVGRGARPDLALSIAATAAVAVAFEPARDRVQRFANRLVYGSRATPYEVLSDLVDRIGASHPEAQLLPTMARTVAQGVGASRVEVWLASGPTWVREAAWPEESGGGQVTTTVPDGLPALPGDRVVPVRHQGELLGGLSVSKPAGEQLTPAEEKLLEEVAAQAGLLMRNVRLIEDLRGSRQRLVTAQAEERRRLERDLHDGAQQRLVSVALMIRTLRGRLGGDAGAVGPALDQAAAQLGSAIEELRELARGIYPSILTRRGLEAALHSLAERSPVPVTVDYRLRARLDPTVEATLYFVAAEALTNVAKYAQATEVRLVVNRSEDEVRLEVTDDGVGGVDLGHGSGLAGLRDRVAVVDGHLEIQSEDGTGTRLTCAVPVRRASPEPEEALGLSRDRTSSTVGR